MIADLCRVEPTQSGKNSFGGLLHVLLYLGTALSRLDTLALHTSSLGAKQLSQLDAQNETHKWPQVLRSCDVATPNQWSTPTARAALQASARSAS